MSQPIFVYVVTSTSPKDRLNHIHGVFLDQTNAHKLKGALNARGELDVWVFTQELQP